MREKLAASPAVARAETSCEQRTRAGFDRIGRSNNRNSGHVSVRTFRFAQVHRKELKRATQRGYGLRPALEYHRCPAPGMAWYGHSAVALYLYSTPFFWSSSTKTSNRRLIALRLSFTAVAMMAVVAA